MIFLSSIRPAIRASRMSPIAAIRHSDNIKIKSKKLKTPAYIHKMFGEGGIIAYKNMKRNKSKYRVVTISICISVTVFIGCIALSVFLCSQLELMHREELM